MKSENEKQSNCCPLCQASILHFEDDQFCVACDWNTMLADVQSGRFERRLGLKKPAKSQLQSPAVITTAIHTKSEDETAMTASAS